LATKAQVLQVVANNVKKAVETAGRITLYEKRAAVGMVADLPVFRRLDVGSAEKAWAVILFVDMRGSTARAVRVGARDTFITMHALLPALAFLANEYNGYIVGFRGDGLFAAFGIKEDGTNSSELDEERTVQVACLCGKAMLEAVDEIVNPVLAEVEITGDVEIGIGVDVGEIVITRIGLQHAHEVTAYGNAVNVASKLSSKAAGAIFLSQYGAGLYPSSSGGRARIELVTSDCYQILCPFHELG
jgi:class 3 adenylate cyclase